MEVDWDLQAVVRSCINRNTSDSSSCVAVSSSQKAACSEYLFEPRRGEEQSLFQELKLNHLHKPFFLKPEDSLNLFSQQFLSVSNSSKSGSSKHSPTPRSKRRKTSMMKRVCHVAAENLSSDVWSWRKYGQKPIKGSPYPRGYYRCSTSKGCMARKQVERNRSDPGMFIVTYTSEHNHPMPTHRNSLAGSTRQSKPPSQEAGEPSKSPEISPVPERFETSSIDYLNGVVEDDEDEAFSTLDMAVDDDEDFFAGLEDFTVPAEGLFPVTCEG